MSYIYSINSAYGVRDSEGWMWDLRALWWIVAHTAGPRRRAPFKASCVLFSSDINFPYILIKITNSTYAPNSAQAGSEYYSQGGDREQL